MKRILTISALVLATSVGAASAMVAPGSPAAFEIGGYVPNADLSRLTPAQVNMALAIIHGGDSEGEIGAQIRSLLLHAG